MFKRIKYKYKFSQTLYNIINNFRPNTKNILINKFKGFKFSALKYCNLLDESSGVYDIDLDDNESNDRPIS